MAAPGFLANDLNVGSAEPASPPAPATAMLNLHGNDGPHHLRARRRLRRRRHVQVRPRHDPGAVDRDRHDHREARPDAEADRRSRPRHRRPAPTPTPTPHPARRRRHGRPLDTATVDHRPAPSIDIPLPSIDVPPRPRDRQPARHRRHARIGPAEPGALDGAIPLTIGAAGPADPAGGGAGGRGDPIGPLAYESVAFVTPPPQRTHASATRRVDRHRHQRSPTFLVPTLALTVPGLLVMLAVFAQGVGALAWIPFVRRSLDDRDRDRVRRRRRARAPGA